MVDVLVGTDSFGPARSLAQAEIPTTMRALAGSGGRITGTFSQIRTVAQSSIIGRLNLPQERSSNCERPEFDRWD
jgi:hypothetical protein